ncbi:hypothetical protein RIF29_00486 [Crotalaria pallida]|uniref:Uncharacterized protein n=1 Tax=Crotalaria pallida TaxID=3830 RepID=A0AAN9IW61_CROPI
MEYYHGFWNIEVVNSVHQVGNSEHGKVLDEFFLSTAALQGNKQDLPNVMNAAEITVGLHSLRQRHWYIQSTCATSGEGLYEGLDWLSNNIANKHGDTYRGSCAVVPYGPIRPSRADVTLRGSSCKTIYVALTQPLKHPQQAFVCSFIPIEERSLPITGLEMCLSKIMCFCKKAFKRMVCGISCTEGKGQRREEACDVLDQGAALRPRVI